MDNLGDRMKRHESVSAGLLTNKVPVVIRVDGRAFHTFLKRAKKPFDTRVIGAMVNAAEAVSRELSGFALGYVQSDEASFVIRDTADDYTQSWFGNDLLKIVSVVSSVFTAHFNASYMGERNGGPFATFDCRAFNVPEDDVANYFVWRQKDWLRNSVQMYARGFYTDKELRGRSIKQISQDLHDSGNSWDLLPAVYRYGTYITPKSGNFHSRENYWSLATFLGYHEEPVVEEDPVLDTPTEDVIRETIDIKPASPVKEDAGI